MGYENGETKTDQKTGFSWKEKLRRASRPVGTTIAALAIGTAGAHAVDGKEKVHGTPVPGDKAPTSTEAPLDPTPQTSEPDESTTQAAPSSKESSTTTPESEAPEQTEVETSFEAAKTYGMEFAQQAVAFIPANARIEAVPHASKDPMLTDYEVLFAPEGADNIPGDTSTRSYIQARIVSATNQVVVNAALETGEGNALKRISYTAEMAPNHPFLAMIEPDAALWGAVFSKQILATPDKLNFMELTLTDNEGTPQTIGVGLGESGTPTYLMDSLGTPLPSSDPEAPVFAERLATADYMHGVQSAIFAELS